MAKAASTKRNPEGAAPQATVGDLANAEAASKARSSRKLLMAAVLMSVASLGGGFFLARMAFMDDASTYEPDYIEEAAAEAHGADAQAGDTPAADAHGGDDQAAAEAPADDHAAPAEDAPAEADANAVDGTAAVDSGLLDFGEILTNINGFNAQGAPTKAFLKVGLVLAYRTDPGAAALVRAREPFMRDLFNGYLRGLNEADLRGMAGVLHVKAELLKRARAAVGNDLPQEILINELIVQ